MEDIREYQRDEREHTAEPMLITKRRSIDLQPAPPPAEVVPQPDDGVVASTDDAADDGDETTSVFPPVPSIPTDEDEAEAELAPVPQSNGGVGSGRRVSSAMDMTECVGSLLSSAGAPDGEMEMTQCVGGMLDHAASAAVAPTSAPQSRRFSTGMDMTECVDSIVFASATPPAANGASANVDFDDDEMEMTGCIDSFVEAAAAPTEAPATDDNRAEFNMDMTQCVGDMFAQATVSDSSDEQDVADPNDGNDDEGARQSGMEMTEAVGGMIEHAAAAHPLPQSAEPPEEDAFEMEMTQAVGGVLAQAYAPSVSAPAQGTSTEEVVHSSRPRRQSTAMDMTACVGTLLYDAPTTSPTLSGDVDDNGDNDDVDDNDSFIGMEMTQAVGGIVNRGSDDVAVTERQSMAMDMTECVNDVFEDDAEEEKARKESNESTQATASTTVATAQRSAATLDFAPETLPTAVSTEPTAVDDDNEAEAWPAQDTNDSDIVVDNNAADGTAAPAATHSAAADADPKTEAGSSTVEEDVPAKHQTIVPGYEHVPFSELLLRANVRFLDKVRAL
jgi:hypothetical protein